MASTTSSKSRRDWLYLAIIGAQLIGMLVLDLVSFYPRSLWRDESSPLHFLVSLRSRYVSFSTDPYLAADPDALDQAWLRALLCIEGLVQLPLALYLLFWIASRAPSSGSVELAAVVFGSVTAMGATIVCLSLWHLASGEAMNKHRFGLLYAMYLPFAIIPALMAIDMYARLLTRLRLLGSKLKTP